MTLRLATTSVLALLASALVATGCHSGTAPSNLNHLDLRLDPARPAYAVLDSTTVRVTAVTNDGTPTTSYGTSFRSLAPEVAIVDPVRGVVYARKNGGATIEVSLGDTRAQVVIAVRGTLHRDLFIDRSQTWRVADTPHVVETFMAVGARTLTPPPDTTVLTIEPGVVVRFRTGAGLIVGDIGPAAIRIASGDGVVMESDTLPSHRGSWVGLYFQGAGHSQLRNLTMRHCGHDVPAGYPASCLSAAGAYGGGQLEILLDGVTISEAHNGVMLSHWMTIASGSRNLSIENTDGFLAQLSPQLVGDFPRGGHFTGNAAGEMLITNGAVLHSAVWSDIGVPLRLGGTVAFSGAENPVLTLPAGIHLRADAGTALSFETGGIVAGNLAGPPVILESTGNGWGGIAVGQPQLSVLRNVLLKDCGASQAACLIVGNTCPADSGLVAEHLTIQGSRSAGLALLYCGKLHSSSQDITITGSATVPLDVPAIGVQFLPPGNYLGNGWDVTRVSGSAPQLRQTWHNIGIPYALMGGFIVDSTLTLGPGVAIEVDTGKSFNVAWGLRAQGTAAEPVSFTSITPGVPGSWVGINVGNAPEGTRLDHVQIADAGGGPAGYIGAVRFTVDPGGVLTNSTIVRSAGCALLLLNGQSWTDDYTDPSFGNTFTSIAGPVRCQI